MFFTDGRPLFYYIFGMLSTSTFLSPHVHFAQAAGPDRIAGFGPCANYYRI